MALLVNWIHQFVISHLRAGETGIQYATNDVCLCLPVYHRPQGPGPRSGVMK